MLSPTILNPTMTSSVADASGAGVSSRVSLVSSGVGVSTSLVVVSSLNSNAEGDTGLNSSQGLKGGSNGEPSIEDVGEKDEEEEEEELLEAQTKLETGALGKFPAHKMVVIKADYTE